MEDEGSKLQESPDLSADSSRRTRVGFPNVQEEKKGKGKIIFILLAIVALGAVAAWLIFGQGGQDDAEEEISPTPFSQSSSPTPTETQIERSGVKIQVLNGTGISGAAGELQEEIEGLGYSDIAVGNAGSQNYKNAEVTFSSGVDDKVKDEITDKLEAIYQDVDVKTGSVGEYDIRITTGYKKGYTPTPTTKAAATSTPTPTAGATGTVSPTLTPTSTP